MMVLILLTKQIDGNFTVYWKTGLRRGGELKVDLGEQYGKLPGQQKQLQLSSMLFITYCR